MSYQQPPPLSSVSPSELPPFAAFGEHQPLAEQMFQSLLARIDQLQAHVQTQYTLQSPPTPQTKQSDPKAAEPPIYNGDRATAREWMKAVRVYIELTPSKFPTGDERRKILWALSYIRGGSAGVWAENHSEAMLSDAKEDPFKTFQEFMSAFEQSYCEYDRAERARRELEKLRMNRGDTVEAYTTAFDALAIHTEYNETALIEKYRLGLPHPILEKIYSNPEGQAPESLVQWKKKARALDNLWHEYQELRRGTFPQPCPNIRKPMPIPIP